jgi:hypothetical protein
MTASEPLGAEHRVQKVRKRGDAQDQRQERHRGTYTRSHKTTKPTIAANVANPRITIPTVSMITPCRTGRLSNYTQQAAAIAAVRAAEINGGAATITQKNAATTITIPPTAARAATAGTLVERPVDCPDARVNWRPIWSA